MSPTNNGKAVLAASTQPQTSSRQLRSSKPGLLSLLQLLLASTFHLTLAYARPAQDSQQPQEYYPQDFPSPFESYQLKEAADPGLWIYLGTAIALVFIGGAFAGLTIALMGQDEVYLQVISTSGEGPEIRNAAKVLRLLKRGKHWVLVTLLVGNVITNETLPIVLDRSIGGGYAAAITSTVLVIIFGEIVPQSICVRYGLPIGAWMAPIVIVLMWITAPITWPIAKLLDHVLGEDHGTTYKKAGLKTLVTLHKTMGTTPGERLNEDEVSIISGVLDLKAKSVGSIMTPMEDVFTLSADAILDETMIDKIMHEGYSRIPVHEPSNKSDFVGMLLVKMLIIYDPEDCSKVSSFELATLPETRPDTSCLDIINFFQLGKSHMVLVSDFPGDPAGALGVVTLEDVIEELIGEEIIDESDVFIDVHQAKRRIQPAPIHRHLGRILQGEVVLDGGNSQAKAEEHLIDMTGQFKDNGEADQNPTDGPKRISSASLDQARSPIQNVQSWMMRRASSIGSSQDIKPVPMHMHTYTPEMKQKLRNMGPSNAASRPQQSRINTVKVKPGVGTIPEHNSTQPAPSDQTSRTRMQRVATSPAMAAKGGAGQDLVSPSHAVKDGVQAIQAGYGTIDRSSSSLGNRNQGSSTKNEAIQGVREATRTTFGTEKSAVERRGSHSTLGSMYNSDEGSSKRSKSMGNQKAPPPARSGSITENVVDTGGVKKLVLEMTSSGEEADETEGAVADNGGKNLGQSARSRSAGASLNPRHDADDIDMKSGAPKKTKKRKHGKKKAGAKDGTHDENRPLMGVPR